MTFGRILGIIVLIWIFVHTISFGAWNWKKNNNKFGAVIVILLALIALILPIYVMFLKVE